jgi:DUF1365 family protein
LRLRIGQPKDTIEIFIDDFIGDEIKVKTALTGKRKAMSEGRLFAYLFRFPLLTLRIIFSIHWQALKLWLKGVKYTPKDDNQDLQQDIYYKG